MSPCQYNILSNAVQVASLNLQSSSIFHCSGFEPYFAPDRLESLSGEKCGDFYALFETFLKVCRIHSFYIKYYTDLQLWQRVMVQSDVFIANNMRILKNSNQLYLHFRDYLTETLNNFNFVSVSQVKRKSHLHCRSLLFLHFIIDEISFFQLVPFINNKLLQES